MKRSITYATMTLGSAALLALSVGCSRENKPAKSAAETSPTFESNVPPSGSMGTTGTEQQGQQAQPGQQAPQAQPGQYGQAGQAGQPSEPMGISNRDVCNAVQRDAKLTIEDSQGGVTIVLHPKSGTDLSTVRDDARMLERHMSQSASGRAGAGAQPGQTGYGAADQCVLMNLGPNVTTSVTEGTDAVRILITTPDNAQVKTIRRQVRDFAGSSSGKEGTKGHQGTQGQGQQR